MRRPRSALFFAPTWPEIDGSAAGVRTDVLVRAFAAWGFKVAVACNKRPNAHAARLEQRGVTTIRCPPNSADALRSTVEATEPDIAIFDRFYTEEQYAAGVRALRPQTLRILDMQDSHALRLSRQRRVEHGGTIGEAMTAWPAASDTALSRELASIWRCDLTLVCSPVETAWLRDECQVPTRKLVGAPLFFDEARVLASHRSMATPPSHTDRFGFVSLGTFRHPPNVDAVQMLVRHVWPRIRAALPDAQLRLIGSHPSREAMALHAPHDGLHVHGHATQPQLRNALHGARALLAPLRFGAGLKGKILEAWAHGAPVVTTPIGGEGFDAAATSAGCNDAGGEAWGGLRTALDAEAFAADAVRMHEDATLWSSCRDAALALRTELFDEGRLLDALREAIEAALSGRDDDRAVDYVGAALWHHRQRSIEYLAKYIELKGRAGL